MATIVAASASQSDVQTAVTAAVSGDTVVIPAGAATWGDSNTQLNIGKAITIRGSGTGATVITLSATGPLSPNGIIVILAAVTLKSMAFVGGTTNQTPISVGANGWRITDIDYTASTHGNSYFVFISEGYGLIDHCTVNGRNAQQEHIFARGPTDSWQTPSSIGGANNVFVEDCTFGGDGYICDANANSRMVVRYCTASSTNKVDAHGKASNTPARSFRHVEFYRNVWTTNALSWPTIEIRGGTCIVFDCSAPNISAANAQNVRFKPEEYACEGFWPNFGVSIASVTAGNPAIITTAANHGYTTGFKVLVSCGATTPVLGAAYTATVTGPTTFTIPENVTGGATNSGVTARNQTPADYPIDDQVGLGMDPKVAHSEPAYFINNSVQSGSADWEFNWFADLTYAIETYRIQTGNPSATFTIQDIIAADRDYFKHTVGGTFNGSSGCGRGTTAQMNAITPTLTGVGFWVTDQGSWNTNLPANQSGCLYRWNGSAWALFYTPYEYPHPLTRGPGRELVANVATVNTLRIS